MRVFSVCVSQRAADGVMFGLDDARFDVRFQAARSLTEILEKNPGVVIDAARVFAAVEREAGVGRPVWESRRLLDGVSSTEALSPLDEFVRDRAGTSLAHVFTLLALVLPREPLQIAFRSLQTDDRQLRGTALEYLDGILPPAIRERLWPFLEAGPRRRSTRPRDEVMAELLRSHRSITVNLEALYQRGAGSGARRALGICHDRCTESHRSADARGGPPPDHDDRAARRPAHASRCAGCGCAPRSPWGCGRSGW